MDWIKRHGVFLDKVNFERKAVSGVGKEDCRNFVDLWVSEGIPFAFRECPHKYQMIRNGGAKDFGIDTRNFGLTGSARCGFSLNPNKNLSNFNSSESDYDVFIVSEDWFFRIKEDYNLMFGRGEVQDDRRHSDIQRQFKRGFFSSQLMPFKGKLPSGISSIRIRITKFYWRFGEIIDRKFENKHKTLRVYKDWNSAREQITTNLMQYIKDAPSLLE